MMNSNKNTTLVKVSWKEKKIKFKAIFSSLTDADLLYGESKKDKMINKIAIKLGKTKEELNNIIASF